MPRWLEGWQLGAVAVGIALLAALLGVPRAAPPGPLPPPAVDRAELARQRAADHARAASAGAEHLPVAVRAVGESVRRTGRAAVALQAGARPSARSALESADLAELRTRVRLARERHGDEPLLALRALQAELFVQAVNDAAAPGASAGAASAGAASAGAASAGAPGSAGAAAGRELEELGGDFAARARAAGWLEPSGRPRIDHDELLALFRVRWTELAGLRDVLPFTPTLDEWRVYYGLLLRLPEQGLGVPPEALAERQLRYVAALEQRDPSYPALFARGTLLTRRGDPSGAAQAFRAYLDRTPNGPWRLRAVNHLLAVHVAEPE